MKKPEIVIGDFIRLNSLGLNKMTSEAPEIATAFAAVMKQLAIKYGNITIPGQPVTTATTTTAQTKTLLELTDKKDFANLVVGDIVSDNEWDKFVITDLNIIDAFNNTFTIIASYKPLIRDPKGKNKKLQTKILAYYNYFVTPFKQSLSKATDDIFFQKESNVVNLLSSMPVYSFIVDNKIEPFYFYQEKIIINKDNFTKEYEFKSVETHQSYFVSLENVIKMFFNDTSTMLYTSQTYLLPFLVKNNLYTPKAIDLIGIKITNPLRIDDLYSQEENFYIINEIIENKPKNKVYNAVKFSDDGEILDSFQIRTTPDEFKDLLGDFYKGIWKEQFFIASPFEQIKPLGFLLKFRTFIKDELENIFVFPITEYVNEISLIFEETKSGNNSLTELQILELLFDNLTEPVNLLKLLGFENPPNVITFNNTYYQGPNLAYSLRYLINLSQSLNYKGVNFVLSELLRKLFTTLPVLKKGIICGYNNPVIKLSDIPIVEGDNFMINKNKKYTHPVYKESDFRQIYVYDKIDLKNRNLGFSYVVNGEFEKPTEILNSDFGFFVKFLKTNEVKIIQKYQSLQLWQGKILDFLINNSYFILIDNEQTIYHKIKDRYVKEKPGIYGSLMITLDLAGSSVDYIRLYKKYNPYNIEIGDKVVIVDRPIPESLNKLMVNNNQDYLVSIKRGYTKSETSLYLSSSQQDADKGFYEDIELKYIKPYELKTPQTTQTEDKIKIGDIVVFDPLSGGYSAKKGATAEVTDLTENFIFVRWLDSLQGTQSDGGYDYENFTKLV